MKKIRLTVSGAMGKMGRKVLDLARHDKRFHLTAGIEPERATAQVHIPILAERELARALRESDVLIEFTNPHATLAHLKACAELKKASVVGTTGFTEEQRREISRLAKRIPVFLSPNMSPGMNLLFQLAREASRVLQDYDCHIFETHHALKKDAPSGTALKLAKMVEEGSGRLPPISAARAGDIVGEHTLLLAGPFERIELTHRAHNRDVFAAGALTAAAWTVGQMPGLYDFSDLMG